MGGRRGLQPGAGEQLRTQTRGRRWAVGGEAVGQRGGAPVLRALDHLATVAVMGGEGQVGVEVTLAQVQRLVGVLKDLQAPSGDFQSLILLTSCFCPCWLVTDFQLLRPPRHNYVLGSTISRT